MYPLTLLAKPRLLLVFTLRRHVLELTLCQRCLLRMALLSCKTSIVLNSGAIIEYRLKAGADISSERCLGGS